MHASAMSNPTPPKHSEHPKVAALLLAAGLSERMGTGNKLLAEIGGEAMVRRAARLLLVCGLDLWVVTGHEREKIEAALEGLEARLVYNPAYRDGQQTSVHAGLAAISAEDYHAVLVALADQPGLERADIDALLEAYRQSAQDKFLVPWFDGRRGNPVVIPGTIVREIVSRPPEPGSGPLTARFPERVERFEAANDHYLCDIDTEEALAHFRRRNS
jgi:molybdenum cofactor cytidylyltransferase